MTLFPPDVILRLFTEFAASGAAFRFLDVDEGICEELG